MSQAISINDGQICPVAVVAVRLARERAAEICRELGAQSSYRLHCRESQITGY